MSTTHPATEIAYPLTVLAAVDTRDYVEDGDRFVPVDGTGDLHDCDRCGVPHVIHVYARDAAGRDVNVGTRCVDADRPAVHAQLARNARTAAAQVALHTAADAARHVLDEFAAQLPAFPIERVITYRSGARTMYEVDRVKVGGFGTSPLDPERLACLADAWARRQANAAASAAGHDVARLRRLIARAAR